MGVLYPRRRFATVSARYDDVGPFVINGGPTLSF